MHLEFYKIVCVCAVLLSMQKIAKPHPLRTYRRLLRPPGALVARSWADGAFKRLKSFRKTATENSVTALISRTVNLSVEFLRIRSAPSLKTQIFL